jgi:hypothetical protein
MLMIANGFGLMLEDGWSAGFATASWEFGFPLRSDTEREAERPDTAST